MSGQNSVWESEPDPRIKWALDILGNDGVEPVSVVGYYGYPAVGGALAWIGRFTRQWYLRRPLTAGIPWTVGFTVAGVLGGPDLFLTFLRQIDTSSKFVRFIRLDLMHPLCSRSIAIYLKGNFKGTFW